MTKEQWRKIKEEEQNRNKGKDLGKVGITSFKSRSFSDWQKAGGKNLFPVDPTKVKSQSEIPDMKCPIMCNRICMLWPTKYCFICCTTVILAKEKPYGRTIINFHYGTVAIIVV